MTPTFFEGPEKKLELVVRPGTPSLRSHGRDFWQTIVRAAGAEVLSVLSNEVCDAYLLSESSLFVHDGHLTMITCGRTRLVNAVELLIQTVPVQDIALLMYERKNEHFPERQPSSFYEDAERLVAWLPGHALRFGDEHDHHVHLFHTNAPYAVQPDDTTLEILMHGLSPSAAQQFIGCEAPSGSTLAAACGIEEILPGFAIDEHAFTPAGYSMNALRGNRYYTIHVTPEQLGSYVSFETNVDFRANSSALVSRVVSVFEPASFDVMAFAPEGTVPDIFSEHDGALARFRAKDRVRSQVGGYDVRFWHAYLPRTSERQPARLTL